MPIISIIVAMAKNRVIGKDNDMPWGRLPIDLRHFKLVTEGNPIIMGRKTYESIGRPLPNRRNIVLSRQDIEIEGCEVVSSLKDAISLLINEKEIFIIGGGHLYKEALTIADKLFLTHIDAEFDGDTFFPEYEHLDFYEIDHFHAEKDDENDHKIIELIASNDKIEEVKSKQSQISKRSKKPITNIKLRMIFE